MTIKQDLIPTGKGIRTGYKLTDCRGLVIHWIGAAQGKASVIRGNFERGELGTQYIIDWYTGGIIQTMPEGEVAYHVGANKYTDIKRAICGAANPNWYLVGIECCIGDKAIPADWSATGKHMELGRPSDVQYEALVEFAADFLTRHGLGVDRLYRHYDITGKLCHVWFCKDLDRWAKFKADVAEKMEGERDMAKEEVQQMVDESTKKAVEKALADRDAVVATSIQTVSPWAKEAWDEAVAEGVLDGTRPGGNLTREQYAVIWKREKAIKAGK